MAISVALNEFNRKKSYKGSVNGLEAIWTYCLQKVKAEKKYFLTTPSFFCEKQMHFNQSLIQKQFIPRVTHKTNFLQLFLGFQLTLFDSFLGQRVVKMHLFFTRKMMVGSKNIFFSFLPPKNQFFKDFIAQKITFLKKDASPGFWVKAF